MTTFKYKEVLGEDRIRIMELFAGVGNDSLQCHLTSELRQGTTDSYDALSYAWGSREKMDEIICCNEVLSITANLAGALRGLRSKKAGTMRRLWVDALCIDQGNSEEKNHQVKHLGRVYEDATEVVVWLGPDKEGIAEYCFSTVEQWTRYLDEQFEISSSKHPLDMLLLRPPRHLYIDVGGALKLKTFMSRAWFSRVWVLQEAGLARKCHLHWGNHKIDLADLIELACFCNGGSNMARLTGGNDSAFRFRRLLFHCVYRTYDNSVSWRTSRPLTRFLDGQHRGDPGLFLDVLQGGRSLFAEIPLDYVYAFLGNPLACTDDGKPLLEPDYKKDEQEVYFDLAIALLKKRHESPYVLCFALHKSANEVTGSNGPSWIPRWRQPEKTPTISFTIGNIGLSFQAGGPRERLQYRAPNGVGEQRLLSLQAITFDQLLWTSEPLKSDNFGLNPTLWDSELRSVSQTCIDMLWNDVLLGFKQRPWPIKGSLPHGFPYDELFSYTLVTGYNPKKDQQKDKIVNFKEHRRRFRSYHRALKSAGHPEDYTETALQSNRQARNANNYEYHLRNCTERKLAVTKSGRYALVPRFAQPGDTCCVFLGMATPFVIRPAATGSDARSDHHYLVGEAYVQDVMHGELVAELDRGNIEKEEITLM